MLFDTKSCYSNLRFLISWLWLIAKAPCLLEWAARWKERGLDPALSPPRWLQGSCFALWAWSFPTNKIGIFLCKGLFLSEVCVMMRRTCSENVCALCAPTQNLSTSFSPCSCPTNKETVITANWKSLAVEVKDMLESNEMPGVFSVG